MITSIDSKAPKNQRWIMEKRTKCIKAQMFSIYKKKMEKEREYVTSIYNISSQNLFKIIRRSLHERQIDGPFNKVYLKQKPRKSHFPYSVSKGRTDGHTIRNYNVASVQYLNLQIMDRKRRSWFRRIFTVAFDRLFQVRLAR